MRRKVVIALCLVLMVLGVEQVEYKIDKLNKDLINVYSKYKTQKEMVVEYEKARQQ